MESLGFGPLFLPIDRDASGSDDDDWMDDDLEDEDDDENDWEDDDWEDDESESEPDVEEEDFGDDEDDFGLESRFQRVFRSEESEPRRRKPRTED